MSSEKQATWGGRFSGDTDKLMLHFSESVSFDARLAPFDVAGSKAHASMLAHVDILAVEECEAIHKGLDEILEDIQEDRFEWDIALEDVHMNIEQALLKKTPAAAKLHTARSRNDQVATDMRLFLKNACECLIVGGIWKVQRALLDLAEKYRDVAIPGYTHLQRAQPVSVAHHLLAFVEMFGRDEKRFLQAWESANVCPLGSGAIAGTTLPIDREFVARELGFIDSDGAPLLTQNSMDAVSDRDVFLEFATACSICGTHLSRLAEDLILWNSSEFGFIRLPDSFTTGSSLMPQKKNPDSLELLRGKTARLQGNLQTLQVLVKGLPLTYNRDLQEDKAPIFDSLDQLLVSLEVLEGTLAGSEIDPEACAKAAGDPLLLATDLADYLVGRVVAFRDAHHVVGSLVSLAEKQQVPLDQLSDEDAAGVHASLEPGWRDVFNLETALASRNKPGMPGPEEVGRQIKRWRESLRE